MKSKCPRCGDEPNPSNRLITDSCGHSKCRKCFLIDTEECLECNHDKNNVSDEKPSVKKVHKKLKHIEEIGENEKGKPQFRCIICNKIFLRSQKYYHAACAGDTVKRFQCSECPKRFATRAHLIYHLESHSKTTYDCPQCKRTFNNKAVLKRHLRVHQPIAEKCNECGKVFRSKDSLAAHKDMHRNNLRFKCNVCDKKYAFKTSLRQHMLKHLDQKHECNYCGKGFQRMCSLKFHIKKHLVKHTCDICNKQYSDAAVLMRHKQVHKDSVKFYCKECNTTSLRKDNMLRHVRNMHGPVSFEDFIEVIYPESENPLKGKITENNDEVKKHREVQASTENYFDKNNLQEPKLVENSSVIRCIGNVKPVKIPSNLVESSENDQNPNTPQVHSNVQNTILSSNSRKASKKNQNDVQNCEENNENTYDPLELYRKILIEEDEPHVKIDNGIISDKNEENLKKEKTNIQPEEFVYSVNETELEDVTKKTSVVQQQRVTCNSSNFCEMHWRKNFKYTYEYQDN